MGKRWDYFVPSAMVWEETLRVVKPGAHGMMFGGPRTFHRLACAIEDGGFIPIDTASWIYGQGFPKSTNVAKAVDAHVLGGHVESDRDEPATEEGKQWDGHGTQLKPAWEPAFLVQKAPEGSIAENVLKWGTGALAIDACRIGDKIVGWRGGAAGGRTWNETNCGLSKNGKARPVEGRWPANVVLDEEAATMLDRMRGDPEGVDRFFYTAKVSVEEREAGCFGLKRKTAGEATQYGAPAMTPEDRRAAGLNSPRAGANRSEGAHNFHPTLKPVDLCRHFARLLLPPPTGRHRRILVPFSGAGSEMIGALQAGWDEVIGIEIDPEYIEIAKHRIQKGGVLSGLLKETKRAAKRREVRR